MMIKRKIYLILSILSAISLLLISNIITRNCNGLLVIFILLGILTIIISLLLGHMKEHRILFPIGLITLTYKKMYFNDIGYLWYKVNYKENEVIVYKQKITHMKELYLFTYEGKGKLRDDIDNSLKIIKTKIKTKIKIVI